jgi:plastocyanin
MRRLVAIIGALAIVAAAPSFAFAGQTAPKGKTEAPTEKAPAAKAMTASGDVTAVAPDSMTVKGKTAEWTFTIDKDTTVLAKGASHKSLALKAEGKASTLTEFVKVGDAVSVTYKEMGAAKLASEIHVIVPTPKK